jgi:hypothetical protein
VYLGVEGPLTAATRFRLNELQYPLRERRQLAKALLLVNRGARAARVLLAQELSKTGLHLKGSEIRGFAHRKFAELLAKFLTGSGEQEAQNLENQGFGDQQPDDREQCNRLIPFQPDNPLKTSATNRSWA